MHNVSKTIVERVFAAVEKAPLTRKEILVKAKVSKSTLERALTVLRQGKRIENVASGAGVSRFRATPSAPHGGDGEPPHIKAIEAKSDNFAMQSLEMDRRLREERDELLREINALRTQLGRQTEIAGPFLVVRQGDFNGPTVSAVTATPLSSKDAVLAALRMDPAAKIYAEVAVSVTIDIKGFSSEGK